MALFASKKKTQMPGHVCFVPDAGALAAQAAVSAELQAQGAQRLCELLQTCSQYEIPHVSVLLGAFNGDYPQEMLRQFLRTQSDFLQEQQVRVLVTEPLAVALNPNPPKSQRLLLRSTQPTVEFRPPG